ERERPAPGEPDPRMVRTEMGIQFLDTALPYFKRMHEMTVDHRHEEIQLLAIAFSTMFFETMAPMPSWRDYYKSTDQRFAYEYLKTVLKVLQWQRGGERLALKSPQHMEQFRAPREVLPDGTVVRTHPDPASVTPSFPATAGSSSRLSPRLLGPAATR